MKNLATALVKAQKAFSPALKNSTNPHFKSRYADLATCVEAVMDALNDNGIALIQKCYECPSGIMVETVFMHESGEIYESGILQFPASKQDPQGYMSALTYARRGSLMAACGIAPEDDDGNSASKASAAAASAAVAAVRAPKPPAKIEGNDSEWQLKVVAKPEGSHADWSQLIIDATMILIPLTNNKADVVNIFKTNRNIYDEVKRGTPSAYDLLMDEFKQAQAKHEKN